MNETQLLKLNASDMPFEDCDYFKWLSLHGDDLGFRTDNLRNYINSLKMTLPLKNDELRTNLKYIHEFFYWAKFNAHKKARELRKSRVS